jgi:hypothetical protein
MKNKKKCFVIMPVSGTKSCTEVEWTGIFEHMIKPAVTGSRLGYDCERAKPLMGAFIRDILEGLNRSDVVIADLTNRNPNVCYELGIRHTLKRRTILIAQNIDDVPSDLRAYWVVNYEKDLTGAENFKKGVREILREMQKNPEKSDSPVADFVGNKNIDILAYEKAANLRKLDALLSELSSNVKAVDNIAQELAKGAPPLSRLKSTCIKLLLSTRYINITTKLLDDISLCDRIADFLNQQLDFAHQSLIMDLEKLPKLLAKDVPLMKGNFASLLVSIAKIRTDYANDNYQEPKEPIIKLASPEHEKYLKITK